MRRCTECHMTPPRLAYVTHDKFISLGGVFDILFNLKGESNWQKAPTTILKIDL